MFFPLGREVLAVDPARTHRVSDWAIVADASPWGGGAALVVEGCIEEYFELPWPTDIHLSLGNYRVSPGHSKFQSFYEALVILLGLMCWCEQRGSAPIALLSDNLGALSAASNAKGRGAVAAVVRELAWRTARFRWSIIVGHVPGELNVIADALSRLHAPEPSVFPAVLHSAKRRRPPEMSKVWRAQPGQREPRSG